MSMYQACRALRFLVPLGSLCALQKCVALLVHISERLHQGGKMVSAQSADGRPVIELRMMVWFGMVLGCCMVQIGVADACHRTVRYL